jgi:uncharacterized membrane protein YfcA
LLSLLTPGLLGVVIGVIILKHIPLPILKLSVGILSVIFAAVLLIRKTHLSQNILLSGITGFIVGILQSTIGVNGPPLVVLLNGYQMPAKSVRKHLAVLFFSLSLFTLPLLIFTGIANLQRLIYGLLIVPVVILGSFLGHKISDKIPETFFRLLTFLLVAFAGFQLVVNNWPR